MKIWHFYTSHRRTAVPLAVPEVSGELDSSFWPPSQLGDESIPRRLLCSGHDGLEIHSKAIERTSHP